MSKRPFVLFALLAGLCLIVLPIYALGRDGSADSATVKVESHDIEGRDLFVNNCGSCHTLAAAGSDGVVGPDLDDTLVTGGINASEQYEGIYGRVLQAVTCGVAGRMPKGILLGEEAQEVSAFVAAYAARIGEGPTVDTQTAEKAAEPDCRSTPQ